MGGNRRCAVEFLAVLVAVVAPLGPRLVAAQTRDDISPFPEASLRSIDPVEALPPPLDDQSSSPRVPPLNRPLTRTPPATQAPQTPATQQATSSTPQEPESLDGEAGEVVRERYPNGRVRVERRVALDPGENFVNHGLYRMLDPNGVVIAEGTFNHGKPEGHWRRWVAATEADWLGQPPFSQFQAPFLSEADFGDGRLHGAWRISDRAQRKVFEVALEDGKREGRAVWYSPQGQPLRETHYRDGLPHGVQLTWQAAGQEPRQDAYEEGRRVSREADLYPSKQKKSEGAFHHGRLVLISEDDWWSMKLVAYESQNDGYRQGPWRVWYPSGQLQMQGEYDQDTPQGRFSWWHPNGQLALQGDYRDGQRDGRWTWWHANGMKRSQGGYRGGAPLGDWAWWSDDGKLSRSADFPHPLQDLDESIPVDSGMEDLPQKSLTRERDPRS